MIHLGKMASYLSVHLSKMTAGLPKDLKVHKIEIFFGFDFEICIISWGGGGRVRGKDD